MSQVPVVYLPRVAIIHQTVIAECERCGQQSSPMLESDAQAWLAKHEAQIHEPEDLAALMAQHGHVIKGVVEWYDQDDSSGYATCSCGFKSRSSKACWIDDHGDRHLREMKAKLGLELPAAPEPAEPAEPLDPEEQRRSRPSPLAERLSA